MIDRVCEPEVMDTIEDAEEYSAIDNTFVNNLFIADVLGIAPTKARVIDFGTGPGDIAILLAEKQPDYHIIALDLAKTMIDLALQRLGRSSAAERVNFLVKDAKCTGFPSASFDLIISNSLVHHIPEPQMLFAEMRRVASPGAAILVKDLRRPESLQELAALTAQHASQCSPYQRRLFANSLHAALTVAEVQALAAAAGLSGCTVVPSGDRHWILARKFAGDPAASKL